jgi:hypothetical protein
MHHDEHLLQLIIDDLAPTQQLLELLKEESLALYGRDMPLLEEILARKQSLIVLLEQHGKKRSQILISLGLPADHDGLAQLASFSKLRPPTSCVYSTAESLRHSITPRAPPRAWSSQAPAAKPDTGLQRALSKARHMLAKCRLLRVVVFCLEMEEPCSTPLMRKMLRSHPRSSPRLWKSP